MNTPNCVFCDSPTHITVYFTGFGYNAYVTCSFGGCCAQGPLVRGETQEKAEAGAVEDYKLFAAPVLLSVCKKAMAEIAIMDVSSLPRYDQGHYLKAICLLDTAIAKAKGE